MAKSNYQFNYKTLSFEKIEKKIAKSVYKIFLPQFIFSLILGIVLFSVTSYYNESPAELNLSEKSGNLQLKYELINKQLDQVSTNILELQDRDDNVYRMIFEAKPIPLSKRLAGFGGNDKYSHLKKYDNADLLINTSKKLDIILNQMLVQSDSYNEISELVNDKEKLASSIPAIQPIAIGDLTRFGSAFGYRIHPIFRIRKMHTGVDLTAPRGTKIYAPGDGIVMRADRGARGYGNCIRINHGYGYVTLYGHLSKMLVRPGQKVKRGDVIGLVGSTGLSTSPHLHYEVRINGQWVNPVNFYYNDLTDEEYRKMIEASSTANTHVFE